MTRHPLKTRLIALAAAAVATFAAGAAFAGDVTVTLSGVQARGGTVYGSLQTKDQFMRHSAAYGVSAQVTAAGTVTLTFHDVAPGEYAFMAMHDENGDHQMNMAASGMPAEGFAMSGPQGYPVFDTAKFTVGADGTSLNAAMVYMDGKMPGH